MPMDDQVVPSQHSTFESSVALTGDLSAGRQLRKSCRFCRSRKIRCSGETNIGCSACRNRNQKCVYEPTAAMGRPRKYPRPELCSNVNASASVNLTSPAPTPLFQRGWSDSRLLMRTLYSQSYDPDQLIPPGRLEPSKLDVSPPIGTTCWDDLKTFSPVASPWRSQGEEIALDNFHKDSSVNSYRKRPAVSHLSSLPPMQISHHEILSTQQRSGIHCGPLDKHIPPPDSGRSNLSSATSHHGSTSQTGPQGPVETNFNHASFSSKRISPELNLMNDLSIHTATGSDGNWTVALPHTQSSHFLSNDNNALASTHQLIFTCDSAIIFQYFQGNTLHATTQAHLQFILREYPNPYISAPHKHPSVLKPKLYQTMAVDVISLITCEHKSTSNRQDGPQHESKLLFNEMLDYDRGENIFQESKVITKEGSLSPLEQLSHEELSSIYSQWLHVNPFGFLFHDATRGHRPSHYREDPALLATIVGWHFYLSLQKWNYESVEVVNRDQQKTILRPPMPFFEYAETELMRRTLSVNELTLTTVRGLVLLAAFRSADSQSRCGWALLSVAHLLTKEYLTTFGGPKFFSRSAGEVDGQKEKILGFHWLLNLFRSWTLLSMGFPKSKVFSVVDGSPSYSESFLTHSQSISVTGHEQVNQEWANRMLLHASQILEVFCTMCREDPSILYLQNPITRTISNDQVSERKLEMIRWLVDAAQMKPQVIGSYNSPPCNMNGEVHHVDRVKHTSHSHAVMAVVCSLFALSRLSLEEMTSAQITKIPVIAIPDVLKLLQIISSEGINPAVLVSSGFSIPQSITIDESLMLGILRRNFRFMTILLQAFVNALSDFPHTSTSDYSQIITEFLEVIESMERFATSGLSLHAVEDFQKVENVRFTLVSLSTILTIYPQCESNQRQSSNLQQRQHTSLFDTVKLIPEPSQTVDSLHPEPLKIKEEYVATNRQPVPINGFPSEACPLVNSYSAPTAASFTESPYLTTSTDEGCLSSPAFRSVSDRTLSVAHPVQKYNYADPKVEHSIMTPDGSGFIYPASNNHGMTGASETEEEVNCGIFRCPRGGEGHYFCALDSSWIPQPPRHQIDSDPHPPQPIHFDSFPRSSTLIHQVSPPLGSPPSYKYHPQSVDYFSRNSELREPSTGCFLSPGTPNRVLRAPPLTQESSNVELGVLVGTRDNSATSTPCPHTYSNNF